MVFTRIDDLPTERKNDQARSRTKKIWLKSPMLCALSLDLQPADAIHSNNLIINRMPCKTVQQNVLKTNNETPLKNGYIDTTYFTLSYSLVKTSYELIFFELHKE